MRGSSNAGDEAIAVAGSYRYGAYNEGCKYPDSLTRSRGGRTAERGGFCIEEAADSMTMLLLAEARRLTS